MPCNLTIAGKNLDIDTFIKTNNLKDFFKSYKGQPKFKSKPNGDKLLYSSISTQTSKADFNDLKKQIDDTIKYLKRNMKKLSQIESTKGIEYAFLDFGINLRIDKKNILTQEDYFPKELLKLVGTIGLGIQLSVYPIQLEKILEKKFKKL